MDLLRELQDLANRYQRGVITLRDVEDALADLAIPVAEAGDGEASALSAFMWRLLSEHSYGHRSEDLIRRELRAAIPLHYVQAPVEAVRTTAADYVRYTVSRFTAVPQPMTSVAVGAFG